MRIFGWLVLAGIVVIASFAVLVHFDRIPLSFSDAGRSSGTEGKGVLGSGDTRDEPEDLPAEERILLVNAAMRSSEKAKESPTEFDQERRVSSFESVIGAGESYITDGLEVAEGVFALSRLTPSLVENDDGSAAIEVECRRFEVDVSGGVWEISQANWTLEDGAPGVLTAFHDKKNYHLYFRFKAIAGGGAFELDGNEEEYLLPPSEASEP